MLLRLGTLDPDDLDARLAAARAVAVSGGGARVAGEFRGVADALAERGERDRALEVLVEAARLLPGDQTIRGALAAQYGARGDIARATEFATSAAEFVALADIVAAQGAEAAALELLERALAAEPGERSLAERLVRGYAAQGLPERARAHLDALGDITEPGLLRLAAELRAAAGEHEMSRGLFARLLAREPHLARAIADRAPRSRPPCRTSRSCTSRAPPRRCCCTATSRRPRRPTRRSCSSSPDTCRRRCASWRFCVDGGLDTLVAAQSALTDAYLAAGRGEEARAVAEDLVTNHPDDPAQLARLRRALQLAGEPDVDRAIAERRAAGSMAGGDLGMDLTDEPAPDVQPVVGGSDVPPAAAAEARPSAETAPAPPPARGERVRRPRPVRPRPDGDRSR